MRGSNGVGMWTASDELRLGNVQNAPCMRPRPSTSLESHNRELLLARTPALDVSPV